MTSPASCTRPSRSVDKAEAWVGVCVWGGGGGDIRIQGLSSLRLVKVD